jgi:hypothetical protein
MSPILRPLLTLPLLLVFLGSAPAILADAPRAPGAPGAPDLRYRFQQGQKYLYEVKISAQIGDVNVVRGGLSIYQVKSATDQQITLVHSGSLSARRSRRDGRPVVTFPSIHDPFFWSGINVTAGEGELTIDVHGKVLDSHHLTPLPYMLGDFQVLAIEPLPDTPQTAWEHKEDATITEKQASRNPMFGPGPPFGSPFGPSQPAGMNRSAHETISFAIVGSDSRVARIKRTYLLRTEDQVKGKPRLELSGQGERSFDLQQGVASSELMKYTVHVNEENESLDIPLTVDYRLLGPQEAEERLKEIEKQKAALPRTLRQETTSVATTDSQLGGGPSGIAFRFLDPDARPVIGVRYQLGSWGGEQTLGHLEPLYTRDPVPQPWQVILAREGYALGALQVDGTKYVNAVRLAFMRLEDDRLNTKDSYATDWIGSPTTGTTKKLISTGARVLGLHGKRAAVLDGVGLVFEAK